MLTQSLALTCLAFLASFLPLAALLGDPLLAARWATLPASLALAFGGWAQVRVIRADVQRAINRASLYRSAPVLDALPPPATVETAPTAPLAPPEPARSVILNHGGKRERMTLMPTGTRLIHFLDCCIALSAPDKTCFPSFSDLRRYGIPNNETDDMLTWLGDAVIRQERKITRIANGLTLSDLRKMAAGG